MRTETIIAAAGLASLLGCSQARTLDGEARRVSWDEVGPLFTARCTSCHSGNTPAAGYRTTSYLEALGPKDAPKAVAGDAASKVLKVLDPASATASHQPHTFIVETVRAWVVEGRLAFKQGGPHAGGILNPNDATEFHGALLSDHSWDLNYCARCHGADFSGGTSGVACTSCHTPGTAQANSCTTCHGNPPASGSHTAHVSGKLSSKLACRACHPQPSTWSDTGHLGSTAQVIFGSLAATPGVGRTAAPAFTPALPGASPSCSNIYCHGGAFSDTAAANVKPTWGVAATGSCGSCHGLPPASHAKTSTDCSKCHWMTVSAGLAISNPALHINGKVEVGDGTGSCTACHGNASSPAPPRDLAGNTDSSVVTVGAHQAHLSGDHRLAAPILCSACHQVPTAVSSPGHVDGTVSKVLFSGIAVAGGAAPVWDRNAASCSATWCHGGATKFAADASPGLNHTPSWTKGNAQPAPGIAGPRDCGSCHGVPPQDSKHDSSMQLSSCYTCHPGTVDKGGNILVSGPPGARVSTHINGVVDVLTP